MNKLIKAFLIHSCTKFKDSDNFIFQIKPIKKNLFEYNFAEYSICR